MAFTLLAFSVKFNRQVEERITLREAAERLGVHYMTVYRYVRLGQLTARKEGRTWLVASPDLDRFQHGNASDPSPSLSRRNVPWHERLHNRLQAGDQSGAWKVVEAALASGMSPEGVYVEMLVPALRSIGEQWESGEIGVEVEHQASVMAGRMIGRLGPRFSPRGRRKGSVVVAAPSGDRHGMGLAMASDILRGAGYTVMDLGPDTPPEAMEGALRQADRPTAACIGVAHSAAVEGARQMVKAARRHLPREAPVILGGGAIPDDAYARTLGAERRACLDDLVAAVEAGRDQDPGIHI